MALSKTQNKRLAGILAVMTNDNVPYEAIEGLVKEGFIENKNDDLQLTDKGLDEKNRLCTLAGLNISYTTEK
jgi:predicted transcriptional regulator